MQIINRFNHYERLKNFEVRVGVNEDNLQNPTCSDRVTSVGQGAALTLSCDPPIPGRYVSVQMFGEGILSMCEVMVYSRVGERTLELISFSSAAFCKQMGNWRDDER